MRKSIFAGLCLLFAAACSTENETPVFDDQAVAQVTVHTSGFEVSQQDFSGTRATAVGDYTAVKMLTLAFYRVSDGTEVYKHTQNRDDNTTFTTFGQFSCYLPIGNYTMVVLANAGNNEITLTSPTQASWGTNNVMDTFVKTQAVNITSTSAVNLNATLERIVSAVAVQSTDVRPAGVTHMRFTFSAGGKNFNPTTGLATSNTGFVTTMSYTADPGSTTYTGGLLFLVTNEQTINVTIETLDAADGNVLFSKTITDVPLMRNRITTLTGSIYSALASSGSFQINSDWLGSTNINF